MTRARQMRPKPLLLLAPVLCFGAPGASAQIIEYAHLDAIGNVRAVTDQNGVVIERHDYLPFGEECLTGPCASNPNAGAGQPRKFTGKERDTETGLDYFGARYYRANLGCFTTVDPVYTWRENILDPQRWNRYAYARNNPLRFTDPDGRVLELVGAHRQEAFSMLTSLVGGSGLAQVERDGRTFVEVSGSLKGGMGAAVAGIIGEQKTATLNVTSSDTWVASKREGRTLGRWGGGATAGSEESFSGLTEIYVALNAGAIASRAHESIGYLNISSDRGALQQSNESVLAHELGHARGNLLGLPIGNSAATFGLAVAFENAQRKNEGKTNFKTQHNPTLWPKQQ